MTIAPLFFPSIPGGVELLVVFFVFFLLFGVPMTLLVALGYKHVKDRTREREDARLDELESEVAELKARLEETDND